MGNDFSHNLLYPELSFMIIGAAMDVHNQLGPGWDEDSYHSALLHGLRKSGLQAESKLRGILKHRDHDTDVFELDILVEDSIILELKHLLDRFTPAHMIQLINYQKFWEKDLGILLNFGLDRLQFERIPFTPRTGPLQSNAAYKQFKEATPSKAEAVESILQAVLDTHGLGYGTHVYRNLVQSECYFRQFTCESPIIPLYYESLKLGDKQADVFCLDCNILLLVSAQHDNSSAVHLARMLSYLRNTGLPDGIIANFGSNELQLKYVKS
jgi:GxxExxY protein